jgi:hypothetical protein
MLADPCFMIFCPSHVCFEQILTVNRDFSDQLDNVGSPDFRCEHFLRGVRQSYQFVREIVVKIDTPGHLLSTLDFSSLRPKLTQCTFNSPLHWKF